MQAEIISIGTEILLGDIVDTNSRYIAARLKELGYDIHYITTVGDNKERLVDVLKNAINRSDLIITTGGLGPTDDDLTREAIAQSSGKKLAQDEKLLSNIKTYFKKKGYNMTKNNYSQALLPKGALPINNLWGTAPGIILKTKDYSLISLPGVPNEMRNMVDKIVLPELQQNNSDFIKSRTLHFFNIGESTLETKLYDILQEQANPTLALLAGRGEVKIRITAKGKDEDYIEEMISQKENLIKNRVGEYLYGVDKTNLAVEVKKLLSKNDLTISFAESCTGGLLGHRITQISGSSKVFKGGLVVYSNQAKINLLTIDEKVIEKHGAVSKIVAKKMAKNVADRLQSDIGIGITGIAGPGGGSSEKPVGLVYIGFYYNGNTQVYKLNLKGNRSYNKWMTSQNAFFYIYKEIKKSGGYTK